MATWPRPDTDLPSRAPDHHISSDETSPPVDADTTGTSTTPQSTPPSASTRPSAHTPATTNLINTSGPTSPTSRPVTRSQPDQLNNPTRILSQSQAVTLAKKFGWDARGDTDDFTYELQGIDGLFVLMNKTLNARASISTAVDPVRQTPPYDLDGSNIIVGVWDAGSVRPTHQEFGGRASSLDGAATHYHSAHVGGTIAASGVQSAAKGMAPRTTVHSYDWNSDDTEMLARGMTTPGQTNKLQVSNHSYGFIVGWEHSFSPARWYGTYTAGATNRESEGFGEYSSSVRDWDEVAYATPYLLICKSAGNDRDDGPVSSGATFQYFNGFSWVNKAYDPAVDPLADGQNSGFDTVTDRGSAKNILTVGAANDAVTGTGTSAVRNVASATPAGFSGYGPTDDGRIKPDIMGNGVSLYSTDNTSDTAYRTLSGTSMSSPNIAGSATLLADSYHKLFSGSAMHASSLKGLIIHTADDLGNAGPDYKNGWGLMNTQRGADLIRRQADYPNTLIFQEESLSTTNLTDTHTFIWDNTNDVRVTLCWSDPPGPVLPGLNNTNLTLMNDLDLRIIDPTGTTNFPYVLNPASPNTTATLGDNFRDNVEQVFIAGVTNAGLYHIEISIKGGTVVSNVQSYSLWVSGATAKPDLTHTELQNTTNTVDAYLVDLTAAPASTVDTNAAWLYWMQDGDTNGFSSNALTFVTNDLFQASIPAQSNGTTLLYYFGVANQDAVTCTLPDGAPSTTYSFDVTSDIILTITGLPVEAGAVLPLYGDHSYPSGVTVNASAPLFTDATNGSRYVAQGFSGTGSVPASGGQQNIQFIIEEPSTLTWHWLGQFEVRQDSLPPDIFSASSWYNEGSTGQTILAQAAIPIGGAVYRFSQWSVNGLRQPDATQTAVNPATGLLVSTQILATALYIDETQDDDGDSLSDWWEYFYFGSTNALPGTDNDLDGFSNKLEFDDGSDPRDGSAVPSPPAIKHTPLAVNQTSPAPYLISATITDNLTVASATLTYNRNASGDTPVTMTNTGGDLYSAAIPAPATNGDSVVYFITASDPAGQASTNGPHAFNIDYPLISISPSNIPIQVLLVGSSTNLSLVVTNSGTADLEWRSTLLVHGLEDAVETGSNGWTHSGPNDLWHISGDRTADGAAAWHCGNGVGNVYVNDMNASLDTPSILLGSGASLTFEHYAAFELDTGSAAWDGAIVEISTNSGASFSPITPNGGYPYTIVSNDASPFAASQPCFAYTAGTFREETFDLSAYDGASVILRFRMGTDSFVTSEGWYVDNIRVTPSGGTNVWLTLNPSTGLVVSADADAPGMTMDSAGIPSGTDRSLTLKVEHNDPTRSPIEIPLAMQVRSRPVLTWADAAQVSTNGEGLIGLDVLAEDLDGETLELRLAYSLDGIAWTQTWLTSATADAGSPVVSNGLDSRVLEVQTLDGGLITNSVAARWSSTNPPSAILLNTNVIARADAFDGIYWSDPVTSGVFLVDNESPVFTDLLSSPSHTPSVWSSAQVVQINWEAATDGDGAGIQGYSHVFSTNLPALPSGQLSAASTTILSATLSEGSNWTVGVQARDSFGNLSPVHTLGLFAIDANAPSISGATLTLSSSDLGSYSIGPMMTGTWAGITDSGSGIAQYFMSLTDGGGTTNGTLSAGPADVLTGTEDLTNTFHVWAQDAVGRIGPAILADLLLLSPGGDHDGDSMSNADEDIAGTSATNALAVFLVESAEPLIFTNSPLPVIQWPWASNRTYQVEWQDSVGLTTGNVWQVTSNPVYTVTNTWAVWTDTNALPQSDTTNRLYRIGVSLTP